MTTTTIPDEYMAASAMCTAAMFASSSALDSVFPVDRRANEIRVQAKIASQYGAARPAQPTPRPTEESASGTSAPMPVESQVEPMAKQSSSALITRETRRDNQSLITTGRNRPRLDVRPQWHAPWKLMRVISGHTGWVRSVSVDVSNEWFATGSADRTIKIWDLASGQLKLTLTGHVHTVRGVAISARHPYLFSVGEDKMVKNWDLETNRVIRSYHGHLSGVYTCALHPTLDILVTGARDSTARVWDMRTKAQVHVLSGHSHTVASVVCQATDPQVITGSHDSTIRQWDLASGRTQTVLTHHKKSVRALVSHPEEYTYASGAPDNIKVWQCPNGVFLRNVTGHNAIVNALAINSENVLVSGGDDGSLKFFDWKSGYNFQSMNSIVQPGSLDAEAAIYAMQFDQTGTRLITCEADKTIKIWREDPDASEDTHPIDMEQVRLNAKRRDMY
ncbi:WD domain, G-beta repeat [Plasmodiophora brassicae]|nr:hypothetical protein PBRA_005994 [Plasmodiophora brassicae]